MATEFICKNNLTGETHSTIVSWESDIQSDITSAATKVANHSGKTGTLLGNGDLVKVVATGVTATVAFCTDPTSHSSISQGQIMLKSIAGGTLSSGDKVELTTDSGRFVTLNSAPDSVLPVMEVHKDDGEIDEAITITGSTTDITNFITLTGRQNKHDGTNYNNSGVQIQVTAVNSSVIAVDQDYTVVEWLLLKLASGNDGRCVLMNGGNSRTRNCIGTIDGAHGGVEVAFEVNGTNTIAMNCIAYGVFNAGFKVVNGGEVLNCTAHGITDGSGNGFEESGAGNNAKNCIALGCTVNWQVATWDTGNSSNNLGKSGDTIPGASSQTSTAANEFVSTTGGSEDFHLKSGATSIGNAVDLGTTPDQIEKDIDDFDRDAEAVTWDIGADQSVAAAGVGADPAEAMSGGLHELNGGMQ